MTVEKLINAINTRGIPLILTLNSYNPKKQEYSRVYFGLIDKTGSILPKEYLDKEVMSIVIQSVNAIDVDFYMD